MLRFYPYAAIYHVKRKLKIENNNIDAVSAQNCSSIVATDKFWKFYDPREAYIAAVLCENNSNILKKYFFNILLRFPQETTAIYAALIFPKHARGFSFFRYPLTVSLSLSPLTLSHTLAKCSFRWGLFPATGCIRVYGDWVPTIFRQGFFRSPPLLPLRFGPYLLASPPYFLHWRHSFTSDASPGIYGEGLSY